MFYKGKHVRKQTFSIRKYSFGAASVLLGALVVGLASPQVKADETADEPVGVAVGSGATQDPKPELDLSDATSDSDVKHPAPVLVQVQDESGSAIANAEVEVAVGDDENMTTANYTTYHTDAQGRLELTVLDGQYVRARVANLPEGYDFHYVNGQMVDNDVKAVGNAALAEPTTRVITLSKKATVSDTGDATVDEKPKANMTLFVDTEGQNISDIVEGRVSPKTIAGYEYVSSSDEDGITTHVYKKVIASKGEDKYSNKDTEHAKSTEITATSVTPKNTSATSSKEASTQLPQTGENSETSSVVAGLAIVAVITGYVAFGGFNRKYR